MKSFSIAVFNGCFLVLGFCLFSLIVQADQTCREGNVGNAIAVGEVGTKVVHEDNEVKVWEMILQPGMYYSCFS